ncbi:SDR family NAD(P)-dependent oxidoreductase [Agaribacterium sp. ZY112]|uniref:SDR family NAD(P)-dependent oxidoreductase n=1 Tax=Agaribacterium sp. ZY112 TaxID=3233574 RepID=UPI0035256134
MNTHKIIAITGATDGIGLLTAEKFVLLGHQVFIHGRSEAKLKAAETKLNALGRLPVISLQADLSDLKQVKHLAKELIDLLNKQGCTLDVLINNAGVFKLASPHLPNGQDQRFVVNTIAPYLLTKSLKPVLNEHSRVVNLSSAAQASVDIAALIGEKTIADDFNAYAQSKLALTQWTRQLANKLGNSTPVLIAVNPGSLLASKMVKQGFGVAGKDINIGADILVRASLADEFANASGLYFDNDSGDFSDPHNDALSPQKNASVVLAIEECLADFT